MFKHIPNILTLFRLFLIPPFLVFLFCHEYLYAFYFFMLAGISDGLDGWIARYFKWQSFLGSFLDPIADKLLITSSFIALALLGLLPWWLVVLVILRDLTISLGVIAWYYFIGNHLNFRPTYLSKMNTVLQISLLALCLFGLAFSCLYPEWIDLFILLTTFTTISSYIDYVWTWGKKAFTLTHAAK